MSVQLLLLLAAAASTVAAPPKIAQQALGIVPNQPSLNKQKSETSVGPPHDTSCPIHTSTNGHLNPNTRATDSTGPPSTASTTLVGDDVTSDESDTFSLCSHEDRGTCGNACCTVQAVSSSGCDSNCAMNTISLLLQKHDDVDLKNVTDIRTVSIGHFRRGSVQYLLSATRRGKNGRVQNLLFSIGASDIDPGSQSVVKGFSESKLVGSFRDYGQNYRNLIEVFHDLGEGWESTVLLHGCGRNGLIREQDTGVLLLGAGTIGLVVGGIVAVSVQLCDNSKKTRRNTRERKGVLN
jgi:hypothetical protein